MCGVPLYRKPHFRIPIPVRSSFLPPLATVSVPVAASRTLRPPDRAGRSAGLVQGAARAE